MILQPSPRPWSPTLVRICVLLGLVVVVLAVGILAPARAVPPRLILTGPGSDQRELTYAREARRLIDTARERVWLAMYVARDDDTVIGDLLDALAAAHDRGVEVRVCLDLDGNEKEDKNAASAARLEKRGVRVVRDEVKVTTHSKMLVVDRRTILAGSHNWTRSALTLNRESSWLVEDPVAAAEAERWLSGIPGW